jgi:hypothetical protein
VFQNLNHYLIWQRFFLNPLIEDNMKTYKVICRSGEPYRFDAYAFNSLADADSFASGTGGDFVIEESSHGVVPPGIVKYRLGNHAMG